MPKPFFGSPGWCNPCIFMTMAWRTIQFLFLLLLIPHFARAELATLIRENKDKCAVITSVEKSPDENYGLRLIPDEKFAKDENLVRADTLENSYFKIVHGKTDERLALHDFDGDNVLYHLMKARNYFSELAAHGNSDSALERKILIRLRMNTAFDPQSHFSEIPDYNDAHYIPANKDGRWSEEIWFHQRDAVMENAGWYEMSRTAGASLINSDILSLGVGTGLQFLNHYNAGMDSAKMPDLIYREEFRAATDLEAFFPMGQQNPIADDYANYFASSLNGRKSVGALHEFSSDYYSYHFDEVMEIVDPTPLPYKAIDFVPSVFWKIRDLLGQEHADQLIWNSMQDLHSSSHYSDIAKAVSHTAHSYRALNDEEVKSIDALFDQYQSSFAKLEQKFHPSPNFNSSNSSIKQVQMNAPTKSMIPPSETSTGQENETSPPKETFFDPIFEAVETGAKNLGYFSTILYNLVNAPINFGADFLSGLLFGHGTLSHEDKEASHQVIAAAGGLSVKQATLYAVGSNVAQIISPIGLATLGVSIVNNLVCLKAEPEGQGSLDLYCAKNLRITKAISGATAGAGESVGTQVRSDIISAKTFLQMLFSRLFSLSGTS